MCPSASLYGRFQRLSKAHQSPSPCCVTANQTSLLHKANQPANVCAGNWRLMLSSRPNRPPSNTTWTLLTRLSETNTQYGRDSLWSLGLTLDTGLLQLCHPVLARVKPAVLLGQPVCVASLRNPRLQSMWHHYLIQPNFRIQQEGEL